MQNEQQIFKLHAPYQPTGDQPQAIEELVRGFKEGNQFETLLGVTGSGKTFTMANVIAQLNKPTLIISHNKTLSPITIIISRRLMYHRRTLILPRILRLMRRLINCVCLPRRHS